MAGERLPQRPFRHPHTYSYLSRQIMHGEFTPAGIIVEAPRRSHDAIPRAITRSRQHNRARLPNVNAGSYVLTMGDQ